MRFVTVGVAVVATAYYGVGELSINLYHEVLLFHLAWIAGHMVIMPALVPKMLGIEWSAPWEQLFARGAGLADPQQYRIRPFRHAGRVEFDVPCRV